MLLHFALYVSYSLTTNSRQPNNNLLLISNQLFFKMIYKLDCEMANKQSQVSYTYITNIIQLLYSENKYYYAHISYMCVFKIRKKN